MEEQNSPSPWSSNTVKLVLAGSALLAFLGFRSCDGKRHSGATTRPHGSGAYLGRSFWRSSGSSHSSSPSNFSTSRGGFGSRGTGIS